MRLCRSCAITRHTAIAAKASIAHRRQMRRGLGIESCIDSIAYERGIADGLIAVLKTAIISYHEDIEDPGFYFTIGDEQMVKDAVDALFVRPEQIDPYLPEDLADE